MLHVCMCALCAAPMMQLNLCRNLMQLAKSCGLAHVSLQAGIRVQLAKILIDGVSQVILYVKLVSRIERLAS